MAYGFLADVIICFTFYRNRLMGFPAPVRGQNGGFPLTLTVARKQLTTGQHYTVLSAVTC